MGTGQTRLADAAVGQVLSHPRIDTAENTTTLVDSPAHHSSGAQGCRGRSPRKKARHSTDSASRPRNETSRCWGAFPPYRHFYTEVRGAGQVGLADSCIAPVSPMMMV